MIDAKTVVSSDDSPVATSPPYWLVLIVLSLVILALIYGGIALSAAVFVAFVAAWWANAYRLERDGHVTRASENAEALKELEARLRAATTRHAEAASALNGEIANRDRTIRERAQELERVAERHAAERSQMVAGYEAALRELEEQSVKKDRSVWLTCFVDPEGNPIGKKGATHILALAIPRLKREKSSPTGLLWVSFPKEGEAPFEANSSKVGVHILIVRSSTGEFAVTVTDLSRSPGDSKQRDHFLVTNPDGVAFILEEYLAGVFRKDLLTAYRDAISVGYIIGKAQLIADYFQSLRWSATAKGLRGGTMILPAAQAPTNATLEAAAARFREAQEQRG
jgi:hypothetical protein